MPLRAQCHHCTGAFDLDQLYGADPCDADRCPSCGAHLGTVGLGHVTYRIERHLKAVDRALQDLAGHPGGFTLDTGALRLRVLAAIEAIERPPALDASSRVVSATRT